MADEMYNRIEKQLEGNSLALSAVAEVLQKMDARMSDQEDFAIAKQEEEEASADSQALIKEIASEVATIIKSDAGMDVSGDPRPAKSTGKTAANADDSETTVTPTDNIEDQQATLQAMQKGEHEEDEVEKDEMEEGMEKYMYSKADIMGKIQAALEGLKKDENGETGEIEKIGPLAAGLGGALLGSKFLDDDVEDDTGAEEKKDEDMEVEEEKSMQKQIRALQKQVSEYELNMKKSIQIESEDRLRKMGFKEENGLQAPQRIDSLGVDGTDVIQKGNVDVDTVDQLAGLSYKELRDMQTNIEAGKTDGIPRELLG